SFSLDIVHARVQMIQGDVASYHISLSYAMVPLIEPLSAENLVGEANTSVSDHKVVDTKPQVKASSSFKIIFEHETLDTLLEHPAA
nr:hypothetical protein [Tanacetum cinerariifolium]